MNVRRGSRYSLYVDTTETIMLRCRDDDLGWLGAQLDFLI